MKTVQLAYEEFGKSDAEPLVILHGFFASSRNWRQIAKQLAQHYHVYVPDLRNHGLSPHHPEMDYRVMADDLKRFIDQHQIHTAKIMGHSMGGKVAMWFALEYPKKVDKLIVVDISPVSYQHSFNDLIKALQSLPLEQIKNRKQADEFLSVAIPEPAFRQFLLQNLQLEQSKYRWRIDLDIFYRTSANIIAFPETDKISSLKNKVLFIMGGNSNYLNKTAIEKIFPDAEIMVLENAGHWLHVEQAEQFCAGVLQFLQQH